MRKPKTLFQFLCNECQSQGVPLSEISDQRLLQIFQQFPVSEVRQLKERYPNILDESFRFDELL
jgi:hypothetical protein